MTSGEYYRKNKVKYSARERARYRRDRDFLWSLKNKPCMDCHRRFHPCAMQFDHVRGKKWTQISWICSKKRMLKEIKKCDLVCGNCHAVRTWTRLQVDK